jgi:hypothetical protein
MAASFPTKANWAAGDILTAAQMDDLAGTVNFLSPVGQTNGSTLVANSSASSGLGWSPTPSASNPVLNSAFQVWQRGTSFSIAASTATNYYADRWNVSANGVSQALTISRQATGDTTNLPNVQYCLRFQRNSGQTGTGLVSLGQPMETINSIAFAGKTITLSFYARAGANYSATSNALSVQMLSGTGTDQNPFSVAYTGFAYPVSSTATLTTTWQRFTFTGSVASTTTELALTFGFTATGTAGAADYFEITGVQIDVGSVALPFRTNGGTFQGELSAAQRYYYRNGNGQTYSRYGLASYSGTTSGLMIFNLPVTMRALPTSVDFANLGVQAYGGAAIQAVSAVTLTGTGASGNVAELSVVSGTGYAAGVLAFVNNNNNAAGYIGVSAEL